MIRKRHRHGWQRFPALTCNPYSMFVWKIYGDLEDYLLENNPEGYELQMEKFWRIINEVS